MVMLLGALGIIAVASSTPADRESARQRLRRHNGKLWLANVVLWAPLVAAAIWR